MNDSTINSNKVQPNGCNTTNHLLPITAQHAGVNAQPLPDGSDNPLLAIYDLAMLRYREYVASQQAPTVRPSKGDQAVRDE